MASDRTLQAWISEAVGGNLLAIQKLIVIHHIRLRAIAGQRIAPVMRAKIDPEDILQEVYTDAVRSISRFENKGPDAFFHWLARILESKLIDIHRFYQAAGRDIRREVSPVDRPSAYESLATRAVLDSLTPSRIMARSEAESLLMAAMAGLSTDHQRVLELRFLKGLTLTQVSSLMDRSPAAVQMLSARALRRLRHSLAQLSRVGF